MKKIVINVEKTNTGFSAYAKKYPVYTTGKNKHELINNIVESLNLYFESTGDAKITKRDISLNYL